MAPGRGGLLAVRDGALPEDAAQSEAGRAPDAAAGYSLRGFAQLEARSFRIFEIAADPHLIAKQLQPFMSGSHGAVRILHFCCDLIAQKAGANVDLFCFRFRRDQRVFSG